MREYDVDKLINDSKFDPMITMRDLFRLKAQMELLEDTMVLPRPPREEEVEDGIMLETTQDTLDWMAANPY